MLLLGVIGGGCATFIKDDVLSRGVGIGKAVQMWTTDGELAVINYYNSGRKLDLIKPTHITHSTSWGRGRRRR